MFAVVAVPVLFIALVWVGVTAYRLMRPETPLSFEHDPIRIRQRTAAAGEDVLVGVREIREDQRYYQRAQSRARSYRYEYGSSEGLPKSWADDLWHRRN